MYANAAELPKDKAQLGDFFTWEAFVGDVAAAAQFLGKQPKIRDGRIGIIGHSEGGLLALVAAAELEKQNQSPAALVLLSTPGRLPEKYISEQLQRLLKIQGATAEQTKYFLDENARITKLINEAGQIPADVPPGLKALYPAYLSKFLHSEFALDPAKSAAAFRGPVLVIAGEKDVQVSAERDAPELDAALKTRQNDDHMLVVIRGASHNLKPVKTDEEPGFAGDVAPGVLDKLGTWLTAKLGVP
jgi:pimeloyl-ACP methyl ester carboxylesterase